jgi:SAM-dependent methyltransferase
VGIEPDKDCLDIIKKRFSAAKLTNPVRPGIGEKTPFLKGQFDLVVSFQVLEHVKDPLKVIKESKRILKPGGCFYAAFPNYFSFWEPHYALLFPTFLGKKIFSFWLKILKKDRRFLDDLNFISAKSISRLLIKNSFIIKSTGKELFQERFDSQKMPKWGQTKALQKIVQLFCKMRLNYFLSTMLCKLNMHYPVNVVAYKR